MCHRMPLLHPRPERSRCSTVKSAIFSIAGFRAARDMLFCDTQRGRSGRSSFAYALRLYSSYLTSCRHRMLHRFYAAGSYPSGMPKSQPEVTPGSPRDTALTRWLDSVIPALFKSNAALAREIGVDRSLIGKWRQGVMPQAAALARLADKTGTDLGTLVRIAGYRDAVGPRPGPCAARGRQRGGDLVL
jgi:transcriptional regulator with XRE-family HTH domain